MMISFDESMLNKPVDDILIRVSKKNGLFQIQVETADLGKRQVHTMMSCISEELALRNRVTKVLDYEIKRSLEKCIDLINKENGLR
jgi:hypothetical protein